MRRTYTDAQGAHAIRDLQRLAGIIESKEHSEAGWAGFSEYDKANTEAAHRMVCGGEFGEET